MALQSIAKIVEFAILAWFALLLANIAWQMTTGQIYLSGMLVHRDGRRLRFHRLQMLAISTIFAAGYAIAALGKGPGTGMPDISTPMLALLIGSHATYLGGKVLG